MHVYILMLKSALFLLGYARAYAILVPMLICRENKCYETGVLTVEVGFL